MATKKKVEVEVLRGFIYNPDGRNAKHMFPADKGKKPITIGDMDADLAKELAFSGHVREVGKADEESDKK